MTKPNPNARYAKPNQQAWTDDEDRYLKLAWEDRDDDQPVFMFDREVGIMLGRSNYSVCGRRRALDLVVDRIGSGGGEDGWHREARAATVELGRRVQVMLDRAAMGAG